GDAQNARAEGRRAGRPRRHLGRHGTARRARVHDYARRRQPAQARASLAPRHAARARLFSSRRPTALRAAAAPIQRGSRMNPRKKLRELLARPGYVVVPGAYDTLTARLAQVAGFDAVYLTG